MNEQIKKALHFRYATKVFDTTKKVSQENIDTIIEAGRLAPTAYGLQPLKLIHVQNPEVRKELQGAAYGQAQVVDASDFFVVAARTDIDEAFISEYVSRIAETRKMDIAHLDGFKTTMIGDIGGRSPENKAAWAGRQAYIALGAMIETAALLEVDACPMEGFNPAEVDRILGLSDDNLTSLGFLAVGYRGEDSFATLPKVRLSKEDFVIKK